MDPITLGAVATGIGTIANLFSTKKTNDANIKMQRETNALNYKMFQEQNQFNKEQIEAQNLYNTPKNQFLRYKDAGLNPYLMMSGGAESLQSQVAQAGTPNPAVSPHVDYSGYGRAISDGFSNAVNMYNQIHQSEAIKADAEGKRIDNMSRLYENWARIRKYESESGLNWAQKGFQNLQSQYFENTMSSMAEGVQLDNEQKRSMISLYNQQVLSYANDMRIANLRYALDVRISKHSIKQMDSISNLNYQKVKESIQSIAESKSRQALNYSEIDLNAAEYVDLINDAAKKSAEQQESLLRSRGISIDNEKKKDLYEIERATMVAKLKVELKNGMVDPYDLMQYLNPSNFKFGDSHVPDMFDKQMKGLERYSR